MNNNNEEERALSLVMNNGTTPSSDGVVYKFRDGFCDNVWIWEITNNEDWGEGFYVLSQYPDDDVLDHVKYMYQDYDWFDSTEMDEMLENGYNVNPITIWYEKNYKLPYQEVTIHNGHVYAHDEETGTERELVKVLVMVQDDFGNWKGADFLMFAKTKSVPMNMPMVMSMLSSMDSKVPKNMYNLFSEFAGYIRAGHDYEVEVQDVFVLDGR